jgi:hypothetical protein
MARRFNYSIEVAAASNDVSATSTSVQLGFAESQALGGLYIKGKIMVDRMHFLFLFFVFCSLSRSRQSQILRVASRD